MIDRKLTGVLEKDTKTSPGACVNTVEKRDLV
jgi:hypothetical protein